MTSAYIKQYSKLYSDYNSNYPKELADLDSVMPQYNYIEQPSRAELPGQIELHMFWQIPLPPRLVRALESYIEQGVFFKLNPDAYYHIDKKYWPLVRHFTGAVLDCCEVKNSDFTYSMELYKKAPWHFDLTELNYNSLECLERVGKLSNKCKVVDFKCLEYLKSKEVRPGFCMYIPGDMLKCLKYCKQNKIGLRIVKGCVIMIIRNNDMECFRYLNQYIAKFDKHTYLKHAVICGKLEFVKYLYDCTDKYGMYAAFALVYGHLECAEYLMRSIADIPKSMIRLFMKFNNTDASFAGFEYLYQHTTDKQILMDCAANEGRMSYVKYMLSRDIPLPARYKPTTLRSVKYFQSMGVTPRLRLHRQFKPYNIIKYIYECRGDFDWIDSKYVYFCL